MIIFTQLQNVQRHVKWITTFKNKIFDEAKIAILQNAS